jgi:hypothetical protein
MKFIPNLTQLTLSQTRCALNFALAPEKITAALIHRGSKKIRRSGLESVTFLKK